jgi:hypothetical protein
MLSRIGYASLSKYSVVGGLIYKTASSFYIAILVPLAAISEQRALRVSFGICVLQRPEPLRIRRLDQRRELRRGELGFQVGDLAFERFGVAHSLLGVFFPLRSFMGQMVGARLKSPSCALPHPGGSGIWIVKHDTFLPSTGTLNWLIIPQNQEILPDCFGATPSLGVSTKHSSPSLGALGKAKTPIGAPKKTP